MAELDPSQPWTASQTREQLIAVAWLRWRIFINAFRRNAAKRSVGGWIGIIVLRILVWGFAAIFLGGILFGCGAAAYYAPTRLGILLSAILGFQTFIALNTAPANLGFDLTPLLRFPVAFRSYLLMRLLFGLLSIPTVVATLALLAAAIGLGLADHALFPWALAVLGIFALHNIFFVRMILAWLDRWMRTRRAREIFGGIILIGSLSVQLFFMAGSSHSTGHRVEAMAAIAQWLHPVTQYLSPNLATQSILDYVGGRRSSAFLELLGVLAFAAVFLAIFAVRLRNEFRGENLSEATPRAPRQSTRAALSARIELESPAVSSSTRELLPSTIAACVQKELIDLKRSGAQLYGLITPLFFVFILSRRHGLFDSPMLLPYAICYTMFGLLGRLYNVLGADGSGYNLYLLTPVRMRDVILAKNIVGTFVIGGELLLTCLVVFFISGGRPDNATVAVTLTWACFALLLNLAVGNLRSVLAPMRFEPGKMRRPPTGKSSGFINLGMLLGSLAVGLLTMYLCRRFGSLWLAAGIFAALDAAALAGYLAVLGRIDALTFQHRDDITTALCRT